MMTYYAFSEDEFLQIQSALDAASGYAMSMGEDWLQTKCTDASVVMDDVANNDERVN